MDPYSNTTAAPSASIQGIVLYPIPLYFIIVSVLLAVGTLQWAMCLVAKFNSRRRSVRDEETARSLQRTPAIAGLPLVVLNVYRALAFRTTVGFRIYVFNLSELFVAIAYVVLLFVWTFIIETNPDGEPLNWSSRAGLLAASQFPFIAVLGTKNNIISFITLISVEKLNSFHRIAARACLILVLIHLIGGGNNFSFYEPAPNESVLFGIVAASAFAGLVVISLRPVRERAYELFFYCHFVAVIVIMVAVILHINFYTSTMYTYYIWPSFAVWAVDRLIRTGRLIYFNFAYSSQTRSTLDATTELLSDSLVRVRFCRPDNFHWSQGQFAYLIMPSVSRLPFEAHPFSIASSDSVLFASDAKVAEDTRGKELIFLIGVKNGFTRRLKDVAARGERVKVYIDGPYGKGVNLGLYDTSLLITGGTGISFALPALLSAIESARNGSYCRRVALFWSIRDAGFLNWVLEPLTKAIRFAPPALKVDIQVFLTRKHPHLSPVTPEGQSKFEAMHLDPSEQPITSVSPPSSDKPEEAVFPPPWMNITSGRPNLERILCDEINAASGKVFVGVCGPNSMTKVVREALRSPWATLSSPLNGGPSVMLHVESFGYA